MYAMYYVKYTGGYLNAGFIQHCIAYLFATSQIIVLRDKSRFVTVHIR